MMKPLRFAQLTDLHFTTLAQLRYPTGPHILERAVEDLNAIDLDFVLFTGDLFHFPSRVREEASSFRALLSGLRHPYYVAFGNHDVEGAKTRARKEVLMGALGDSGLSNGSPYYHFSPAPGVRVLVLDSTDSGAEDYHTWRGRFSEEQAEWAHRVITEAAMRQEVVIVGMHHPPVTPYPLMGPLKFEPRDRRRLAEAVGSHSNVAAILCGHYHLSSRMPFKRTRVLTAPSLVEHPHLYRIFTLSTVQNAHVLDYTNRRTPVCEHIDAPCATGTALRHVALNGILSKARKGQLSISLPS